MRLKSLLHNMEGITKSITKTENGVHFLGNTNDIEFFENDYLKVREKEGRIFSDDLVKKLPYLPNTHALHGEWLFRASTQNRFCNYLASGKKIGSVLDIGCGNGWFTHKLKIALPNARIFGLDINKTELQQAAKLFSGEKVTFLYGNLFQELFVPGSFDIIVLNSAVQYFSDFKRLINSLLELISKDGEIHILDSPFYKTIEHQKEAFNRSHDYFSRMGIEEMINHYHHHTYQSLQDFSFTILSKPRSFQYHLSRIFGIKSSPFPWIRIDRN